MEKALTLALFTLTYGIVSGQFCTSLPTQSTILTDFEEHIGSMIPAGDPSTMLYTNCIAYDADSMNYAETTVTVQYRIGSSVFSAQATYVCRLTEMGEVYVWAVAGKVMPNTGTTMSSSGCIDCMGSTATNCTPCDSSDCGNGVANMFCTGCDCNAGYTGANCTSDINECESLPNCEGGGNCMNTIGSFSCTCPNQCTGDCNACCSSPCEKGGTCISDNPDTFMCNCPDGFTGETCRDFVGGCFNDPCVNGGECVDVFVINDPLAYRCVCPMGYTGVNCGSLIDYCESQPCMHGGWCSSSIAGHTCACLEGFTDSDCSLPLQACQLNALVCGSNGVCFNRTVNNILTSYCSCNQGYTGVFCDEVVTSCSANDDHAPCRHLGTCENFGEAGNESFVCNCTDNWTGFYCTDCGLQCVNGNFNGKCTECECDGLWIGENCNDCSLQCVNGNFNGECTKCECDGSWIGANCDNCGLQCMNGYFNGECTECECDKPWIGANCDMIQNCTSYDNDISNCLSCEEDLIAMNNTCIRQSEVDNEDHTAETVGIVLGCIAGAVIILLAVFVMLIVALHYVRKSGMASMRKNDPALLGEQQARLSGFFAPKSTLFSSGGHTGGIRTGVDNSFPSYKEMANKAYEEDVANKLEYENDNLKYQNASPDAVLTPEYDEEVRSDEEWLPPPDD